MPFFPSVFPSAEANGPAQRAAASGLRPFRESLAAGRGLARRLLAAPLGFTLLGSSGVRLARNFARAPLSRFANPRPKARIRRRPRVSIGARLTPSASTGKPAAAGGATLPGFLHQYDPGYSSEPTPGLCVHLVSRRALLPAFNIL
jgi:hypothetical protein